MNTFVFCLAVFCVCSAFAQDEEYPIIGGATSLTGVELDSLAKRIEPHLKKIAAQQNGADLEIIRVHSGTSQLVAGYLHELFAELNENKTPVNCSISLWEKGWVEDFVRLNLECGEEKRKYQFSSGKDDRRKKRQVLGGFSDLPANSIKELDPKLTTTFEHLRTEKPGFDLTFKRVVSGKSQTVAGTRYQVTIEATNSANELRTCESDILENLHGEFEQVDLKCGSQNHRWTKQ